MNVYRFVLIIAVAVFFAACDRDNETVDPGQPLSYEEVTTSSQLRVSDPDVMVYRSWEQWSAFWADHPECSQGCVFEVPYVDFETQTVAAMFWGLESYGCVDYSERVASVQREGNVTEIELRNQPLDPSREVCFAETYAYLFVKFERADGPVKFTGVVPN